MINIDKRSKIAIGIIIFLEFLFLARAYIIYSFLRYDSLNGDGVHDPTEYDKEFLSTVIYSVLIMVFLSIVSILIFRKKNQ